MNAARRPNGPLVKSLRTHSLFSLAPGERVRSCPVVGKSVAEPDSTEQEEQLWSCGGATLFTAFRYSTDFVELSVPASAAPGRDGERVVLDGQFADANSGCCEDGIDDRRRNRRDSWLPGTT